MRVATLVLPVGFLRSNCVVLSNDETNAAIVVDPGGDVATILRGIEQTGCRCRAILNTHAHVDHVAANFALKEATGCALHLHAADLPLYDQLEAQTLMLGGLSQPFKHAPIDVALNDGDRLRFGRIDIEVLHTPGHSPGSVCFLLDDQEPPLLLSGDTLFAGGIGRADLWGGDIEKEMQSIRTRLMPLRDDTRVVPGHGPETTIGAERRGNPFLLGADYS